MSRWFRSYKWTTRKFRYLSIFGNLLISLVAAGELYRLVRAASVVDEIPPNLVPLIVWWGTAQISVTLIGFYRAVILWRLHRFSAHSFILSGILSFSLLFVYWADSVFLWTNLFRSSSKISFGQYDLARQDWLTFIAPMYIFVAAIKTVAVVLVTVFKEVDDVDFNS